MRQRAGRILNRTASPCALTFRKRITVNYQRKAEGTHMIAQELEVSLHMAFVEARQQRHEFITVEHLLLALLGQPQRRRSAARVLCQHG